MLTEQEKHKLFVELVQKGYGAGEALLEIRLKEVDNDYQEFYVSGEGDEKETLPQHIANLHAQIRSFGHSIYEAERLMDIKVENIVKIETLKQSIRIGKYVPMSLLEGWDNLTEQQRKDKLWEIGLDVREYNYVIDVCCQRVNNKVECGEFVFCSERTDDDWLKLVVNGCNVASEEARYHKDLATLNIMRNNKKS